MARQRIAVFFLGLFIASLVSFLPISGPTVQAATCKGEAENSILTIQPWYSGLCKTPDGSSNDVVVGSLPVFASRLGLNLLSIALQVGGYLAVGYVIWGGIKYILAAGDAGKLSSAKTIIQNALTGLLIILSAIAIERFIQGLF